MKQIFHLYIHYNYRNFGLAYINLLLGSNGMRLGHLFGVLEESEYSEEFLTAVSGHNSESQVHRAGMIHSYGTPSECMWLDRGEGKTIDPSEVDA